MDDIVVSFTWGFIFIPRFLRKSFLFYSRIQSIDFFIYNAYGLALLTKRYTPHMRDSDICSSYLVFLHLSIFILPSKVLRLMKNIHHCELLPALQATKTDVVDAHMADNGAGGRTLDTIILSARTVFCSST